MPLVLALCLLPPQIQIHSVRMNTNSTEQLHSQEEEEEEEE